MISGKSFFPEAVRGRQVNGITNPAIDVPRQLSIDV